MQELRLVGVHQDGRHLLLAAPDGTRYRVAINDELRVAARHRATSAPAAAAIEPMSARDIQALIRSGVSAVEAADRSGWALSKVEVFAAPVLAERAHISGMAARTRLRSAASGESERLETRVDRRLAGRGVEPGSAIWDAGRRATGEWQVFCDFVAGGRQRRAAWSFDVATGTLHPVDDEARWLAGDDDPGAKPQPHRLTGERVFDVEVDGGLAEPGEEAPPLVSTMEAAHLDRTDALMTAIRAHSHAGERRGRRRQPDPGPTLGAELPAEADTPAAGSSADAAGDSSGGSSAHADAAGDSSAGTGSAGGSGSAGHAPGGSSAHADAAGDSSAGTGSAGDAREPASGAGATAPASGRSVGSSASGGSAAAAGAGTPAGPLSGADELTFAGLDIEAAPDAGDGRGSHVGAGTAKPATGASAGEAPSAGGLPTSASALSAGTPGSSASTSAAPAAEGNEAGDLVDFPDSDEIPPPARGIHPLDAAREAAEAGDRAGAERSGPAGDPAAAVDPASGPAGDPAGAPEPASGPAGDPAPEPAAPKPAPPKPAPGPSGSRRKGRVGVPNWNDVMFGPAKDAQD